jgi:hypothetical protein
VSGLAAASAAVSFSAQYNMVLAARKVVAVAALEAAIPDASALIFASLGIVLALHGHRAVRTRLLNVASVGTSVFMNALASAPGWRSLAIWAGQRHFDRRRQGYCHRPAPGHAARPRRG